MALRLLRHIVLVCAVLLTACVKERVAEAPVVEVSAASRISDTGAILNGTISSEGSAYVTNREFRWSTNKEELSNYIYETLDAGDGPGSFSCELWGLTPGTTYYFMAYAVNADWVYAESRILSFTTTGQPEGTPTVKWDGIYDIRPKGATLRATVTDDGKSEVTATGFILNKDRDLVAAGKGYCYPSDGIGLGVFACTITDAEFSTTYYVRAFATNSSGTAYTPEILSFTSLALKTKDISGAGFLALGDGTTEDPDVRYRLKGRVSRITNQQKGSIYLYTSDGCEIYVPSLSITDRKYAEAEDGNFQSLKLRVGDEVTLVGFYWVGFLGYAYVESSHRMTLQDFNGQYTFSGWTADGGNVSWTDVEMKCFEDSGDLYFGSFGAIKSTDMVYKGSAADGAEGYYDDETGHIVLMGERVKTYLTFWYYPSNPDVKYKDFFYPLRRNNYGNYEQYGYSTVNGEIVRGTMTLVPTPSTLSSYGFILSPAESEPYFGFIGYTYDQATHTIGTTPVRTRPVFKLYNLRKTSN